MSNDSGYEPETRYFRLKNKNICIECQQDKPVKAGRCSSCYERQLERTIASREKARAETLEAYGGARCACCGETSLVMLALDHIAQDGAAKRKSGEPKGYQLYYKLRRLGFPPGFRVLCYNCNIACYRSPDGRCPHKTGCFSLDSPLVPILPHRRYGVRHDCDDRPRPGCG